MKFAMNALVVVLFTSVVWAQPRGAVQQPIFAVSMSGGQTFAQEMDKLAASYRFNWKHEEGMQAQVSMRMRPETFTAANLLTLIAKIAERIGANAIMDGSQSFTIISTSRGIAQNIYAVGPNTQNDRYQEARAEQQWPEVTYPPQVIHRGPVYQSPGRPINPYDPCSVYPRTADRLNCRADRSQHIGMAAYGPQYPVTNPNSRQYYRGSPRGNYNAPVYQGSGYGYGNYAYANQYFAWMTLELCQNLPTNQNCTHGTLKIDGPEMRDTDLYVAKVDETTRQEGIRTNLGVTSKHNSFFNRGYPIEAGVYRVWYVQKRDGVAVFEDVIRINNNVINRGDAQHFRVDKDRFLAEPVRFEIVPQQGQTVTSEEWRQRPRP